MNAKESRVFREENGQSGMVVNPDDEIVLSLKVFEVNIILESMFNMPYGRVRDLIVRIQKESEMQIINKKSEKN